MEPVFGDFCMLSESNCFAQFINIYLTVSPAKLSSSLRAKLCAISSQIFSNRFVTSKFCFLLHLCNPIIVNLPPIALQKCC